jgi:hypothetical protein
MFVPLAEVDWNSVFMADPSALIVCALWLGVGLVVLAAVVAVQWRKVRIAKDNASLKQQMIERGFTAEEIIRVINAGAPSVQTGRMPHATEQTPNRSRRPASVAH